MNRNIVKNMLAIVVMAGIAIGASLIFRVSSEQTELSVPTSVEVMRDGNVAIATRSDLLIADEFGSLKKFSPLSDLGITGIVNDLQALPNGNLLLAEAGSGVIHSCSLISMSCIRLITPAGGGFDPQANSVKIAFDESEQLLYLANPWKQQISKYDMSGKYLGMLKVKGDLLYPNDMWVLDNGQIVIADTNHHRVVTSADTSHRGLAYPTSFQGDYQEVDFSTKGYPLGVVPLSGKWWVVQSAEAAISSWISVFDIDGNHLFEVNLKDGDDPVAIEPYSRGLILAVIQNNARIAMFDANGEDAGRFEGDGLFSYFEKVRNEQVQLSRVRYFAWGIMALAAFLALFVVHLEYNRKETV